MNLKNVFSDVEVNIFEIILKLRLRKVWFNLFDLSRYISGKPEECLK